MKIKYLFFLALTALCIFFSSAAFSTPVSINGKLYVSGKQLVNECGYPVQLRGVSTHGLQWYSDCYTAAMMDFVANTMNADVLRVAVYSAQGGYVANPVFMANQAISATDLATARGMYVILDWHILYDSDPNSNSAYAQEFFTDMATKYKDNNNVIYEICNEPNGATTWAQIKTYANIIIPLIRAINPDAVIIVGTPNWSQLGSAVTASPLDYTNIMYAFHFYAGTHTTSMLKPYIDKLPIFVTEWGPSDSTGNGGDNYTVASSFLDIMGGNNSTGVKISWAEWSLADNTDSSSILKSGTCGTGVYDLTKLSTAGSYVYDKINNPAKDFVCVAVVPAVEPTPAPDFVSIYGQIAFPNPTTGSKITFRYNLTGYAEKLKVAVYTFGERKIYQAEHTGMSAGTYEEEWVPSRKLANGLYYYKIEATNGTGPAFKRVGAFFVNRNIPTP